MIGTAALLDYKPSAPAITGKAPMDSRDIAGDILRRQSQMEADRANWESYWQQIADFVAPQTNFTLSGKRVPAGHRDIFDSTPELASDRFSAAFNSILTPKNQMWHLLKPVDDDLADDAEVKRWTER
jgi:hypothetical protein